MKKTLLTFAAILFAVISMNAQDLYLSWEGETLGDTVMVWGSPDTSEIILYAHVYNNTDNEIGVKVRRRHIETVDSTGDYFCWGACFPDFVDESDPVAVAPGLSADEFSSHYKPQSHIGTSIIEYTFFNVDNEDQSVSIVVKYWASPQGIAEDVMNGGSISDIYPNPATQLVNLDYNMPSEVDFAKVRIVNLLGAVVKESVVDRNANKLTMDVSDLEGGIYFYNIIVNGDIYKTKKLIVRK